MIQEVEKPSPGLVKEVRAYLEQTRTRAVGESSGGAGGGTSGGASAVCGEHDPVWLDVLRDALGHRPFMLIARDGQQGPMRGYLPLALVASRLFGRFLVSLPYVNRAGVVADDARVEAELVGHAVGLADRLKVQYLELRHQGRGIEHASLEAKRDDKFLMILDLPDDEDGLWKVIGSKARNQVRKGDKVGLTLRWGGLELLDQFYDVFAVNMRDLGTPVFPKKLFGSILNYMPNRSELAVVGFEGRAIAGAVLVHDPGLTQVPSASCLRQYNHTNANMWMYHKLLLRAIERGTGRFDFGRSSEGSGTYRFKKQWGALPQPTVWQYYVREGDFEAMRPDNPKNQRRVEMWQKLPVWLTRLVGPRIVRGIP